MEIDIDMSKSPSHWDTGALKDPIGIFEIVMDDVEMNNILVKDSPEIDHKFNKRLIRFVRHHRELYDPKHEHFANSEIKTAVWEKISMKMNCDVDICKNTWVNLRYAYQKYVRSLRKFFANKPSRKRKHRPVMRYETEMIFLWRFIVDKVHFPLPSGDENVENATKALASAPEDDDIVLLEDDVEVIDLDGDIASVTKVPFSRNFKGQFLITPEMRRLLVNIEPYEELYDCSHKYYEDYRRKGIIWNAIANEVGDKATKLMKCWVQIQARYEWEVMLRQVGGNAALTKPESELEHLLTFFKPHILKMPNTVYKSSFYLKYEDWCEPIDHFKNIFSLLVAMKKYPAVITLTETISKSLATFKSAKVDEAYTKIWADIAAMKGGGVTPGQCETTWLILRSFYWELVNMRKHSYQLQDKWYFETIISELYGLEKIQKPSKAKPANDQSSITTSSPSGAAITNTTTPKPAATKSVTMRQPNAGAIQTKTPSPLPAAKPTPTPVNFEEEITSSRITVVSNAASQAANTNNPVIFGLSNSQQKALASIMRQDDPKTYPAKTKSPQIRVKSHAQLIGETTQQPPVNMLGQTHPQLQVRSQKVNLEPRLPTIQDIQQQQQQQQLQQQQQNTQNAAFMTQIPVNAAQQVMQYHLQTPMPIAPQQLQQQQLQQQFQQPQPQLIQTITLPQPQQQQQQTQIQFFQHAPNIVPSQANASTSTTITPAPQPTIMQPQIITPTNMAQLLSPIAIQTNPLTQSTIGLDTIKTPKIVSAVSLAPRATFSAPFINKGLQITAVSSGGAAVAAATATTTTAPVISPTMQMPSQAMSSNPTPMVTVRPTGAPMAPIPIPVSISAATSLPPAAIVAPSSTLTPAAGPATSNQNILNLPFHLPDNTNVMQFAPFTNNTNSITATATTTTATPTLKPKPTTATLQPTTAAAAATKTAGAAQTKSKNVPQQSKSLPMMRPLPQLTQMPNAPAPPQPKMLVNLENSIEAKIPANLVARANITPSTLLNPNEIMIELISSVNGNQLVVHGPPLERKYSLSMNTTTLLIREVLSIPYLHKKDYKKPYEINLYWQVVAKHFNLPVHICKACWNFLSENFAHFPQIAPIEELTKPIKLDIKIWNERTAYFESFNEKATQLKLHCMKDAVEEFFDNVRLQAKNVPRIPGKKLQFVVDWRAALKSTDNTKLWYDTWCLFKKAYIKYMTDLESGIDNKWSLTWWRVLAKLDFLLETQYHTMEPYYYLVRNKIIGECERCIREEQKIGADNNIKPLSQYIEEMEDDKSALKKELLQQIPDIDPYRVISAMRHYPQIYEKTDEAARDKAWEELANELQTNDNPETDTPETNNPETDTPETDNNPRKRKLPTHIVQRKRYIKKKFVKHGDEEHKTAGDRIIAKKVFTAQEVCKGIENCSNNIGIAPKKAISEKYDSLSLDHKSITMDAGNNVNKDTYNVIKFVDLFPQYESHYGRKEVGRKYLHPNLSLENFYNEYKKTCQFLKQNVVSMPMFIEIFNENFKLNFKRKLLTCKTCVKLQCAIEQSKDDQTTITALIAEKKAHMKAVENILNEFDNCVKRAVLDGKTAVLTFGFDKALATPAVPMPAAYYKRPLWTYNLCIYDEVNRKVTSVRFAFQYALKNYRFYAARDPANRCRLNHRYYKQLGEICRAIKPKPTKKLNIKTPSELNQTISDNPSEQANEVVFPERYIMDINMSTSSSDLVMKNWAYGVGIAGVQADKLKELFDKYRSAAIGWNVS